MKQKNKEIQLLQNRSHPDKFRVVKLVNTTRKNVCEDVDKKFVKQLIRETDIKVSIK